MGVGRISNGCFQYVVNLKTQRILPYFYEYVFRKSKNDYMGVFLKSAQMYKIK